MRRTGKLWVVCLAAGLLWGGSGAAGAEGGEQAAQARSRTSAAADRARALLTAGDFDGAVHAARAGVADDPDDIECRVIRAVLNQAMWDESGNTAALNDLRHVAGRVFEARETALRLAGEPDPEEAWNALDAEAKENLDERFVRWMLAEVLAEAGRDQDAERQQAWFAARYPDGATWRKYALGAMYALALMEGAGGGVREAFLEMLWEDPDDLPFRWLLALADQRSGNHSAALTQFEHLLGKTAEPVGWIHHGYVTSLLGSGRVAEAVEHGRIAADGVRMFVPQQRLVQSLLAAGRRDEAVEAFRDLVPFFPEVRDQPLGQRLARILRGFGIGPDTARSFFDGIIGGDDENRYRLYIAAGTFRELGYREAALQAFLEAAETPDSRIRAMALNEAGRLLTEGGVPGFDAAQGIPYLREAAELGSAAALGDLGYLHHVGSLVERDRAQAREFFERAVERGSHGSMSNLSIHMDDPYEAMRLVRWAMYLGHTFSYNNAAYQMLSLPEFWDPDKAARHIEYALSSRHDSAFFNTLYRVHEKNGNWQETDMAWRRWEHWWRNQRGNRDRELPRRWAARRDKIDEELAKSGMERGTEPLRRQAPAYPDWPDPSNTWGPPRPVAPVPEGSLPAVPLRLVRREREAPTPEQQAWVLAARALDAYARVGNLDEEPSHGEMNLYSSWFPYWWNVFDRREFRELMQAHEREGDRTRFDQLAAHWLPADPDRWAALLRDPTIDPEELHAIKMVLDHGEEMGPKSILAFDLVAYLGRVVRARLAGFITAEEAWHRVMPAARLLQETFDSWEDMGRNYRVGYRFAWFRRPQGIVLNMEDIWLRCDSLLRDEDSPWHTIPWDLDLEPPTPEEPAGT